MKSIRNIYGKPLLLSDIKKTLQEKIIYFREIRELIKIDYNLIPDTLVFYITGIYQNKEKKIILEVMSNLDEVEKEINEIFNQSIANNTSIKLSARNKNFILSPTPIESIDDININDIKENLLAIINESDDPVLLYNMLKTKR